MSRQFQGRWFRVYDEAADDPKIQMLSDELHRFLFNCWCLASKHDGYLPPIPEIAWRLRKTESKIASMLAKLNERGLLEEEGNTFQPHNWHARQYQSDVSTQRVREHRKRHRNGDETFPKQFHDVPETPSEQNRTETEQKQSSAFPFPSVSDFPLTDAAIRRRCPTADLQIVTRITEATVQAYLSVGQPKIPPPDDGVIAAAVDHAAKDSPKQQGPALFLKTVPAVMKSWAQFGRGDPPGPKRLDPVEIAKRNMAERQKEGVLR